MSSSDIPRPSGSKSAVSANSPKSSILTRNPFLNFMREFRASHPDPRSASMAEILKQGAEMWRNMSPQDKLPYKTSARQAPKRRRSRTRSRSRRRRSRRRSRRSRSRKRRRMRRRGILPRKRTKKDDEQGSSGKQENSNATKKESNHSSKSDHNKGSTQHFCVRCKKADPPKNRAEEQKNPKNNDDIEQTEQSVKICSQCQMECEHCKRINAQRDQSGSGTSKAASHPDFTYLS